jgi:hypothetical protein
VAAKRAQAEDLLVYTTLLVVFAILIGATFWLFAR